MKSYAFSGEKLITTDLLEDLPEEIIDYLWFLIEDMKKNSDVTIDYLQVFELNPINNSGKNHLSIHHIQEVPPYEKSHVLEINVNITGKIFVIDDIDYVNMMWASSY